MIFSNNFASNLYYYIISKFSQYDVKLVAQKSLHTNVFQHFKINQKIHVCPSMQNLEQYNYVKLLCRITSIYKHLLHILAYLMLTGKLLHPSFNCILHLMQVLGTPSPRGQLNVTTPQQYIVASPHGTWSR